jgi:hypothetical protein
LQQAIQAGFVETASLCLAGYAIAKALEFGRIEVAHPLILLGRHDDGYITVLPTDHDWLALGRIQKRSQSLLGLGGRYSLHTSILDEVDKIDNYRR